MKRRAARQPHRAQDCHREVNIKCLAPTPPWLPRDVLLAVHRTLLSTRLDRIALLAGIHPQVLGLLPSVVSPAAQTLVDLSELNVIAPLADGSLPLHMLLENAMAILGVRPEAGIVRKAVRRLVRTFRAARPSAATRQIQMFSAR